MIDTNQLAADVANGIADMPAQLEFAGQTIAGSMSPIREGNDVDEIGTLGISDCEFVAFRSSFAGGKLPRKRVDTVRARQSIADEWASFHVDETEVDIICATLRLRKMD